MFRNFKIIGLFLVLALLFTGCVKRKVPLNPYRHTQVHNTHNVNDVDLSDLDNNMTESNTTVTHEVKNTKLARIAFPTSEYYSLPRIGKGTVRGKIYVTDLYGSTVMGAGTRLYLNPITSYSRQWYEESYLRGAKMQKADSRLFNYLKFTASNGNGEFAFYGVPNGNYYLIGTVKCAEQCGYATEKSIRIATKVSVHGNEVVTKNLTRATH